MNHNNTPPVQGGIPKTPMLTIVPPPSSWIQGSKGVVVDIQDDSHSTVITSVSSTTALQTKQSPKQSSSSRSTLKQTTQQIPVAAQELISNMIRRAYHYTRISYVNSTLFGKHSLRHSEVGSNRTGYNRRKIIIDQGIRDKETGEILWEVHRDSHPNQLHVTLPAFSSLNWVDRQLVQEWRTCDYTRQEEYGMIRSRSGKHDSIEDEVSNNVTQLILSEHYTGEEEDEEDEASPSETTHKTCQPTILEEDHLSEEENDFEQAKVLMPKPAPRPSWEKASSCYTCQKLFGPTLLRHHCRLCGRSYCHPHSRFVHRLPHLGYDPDVPERVCASCKQVLDSQAIAERIAWRMARIRDYFSGDLRPYFETGVDSLENAIYRVTRAAIKMAKSIPLGTQATVAVEVLDILRKHGLNGLYGLILRREFLEAADLLCKVTGINKSTFPLSFMDLTAAIFYSLAQQRALRGVDPEREHRIHSIQVSGITCQDLCEEDHTAPYILENEKREEVLDLNDDYDPLQEYAFAENDPAVKVGRFRAPERNLDRISPSDIPQASSLSNNKSMDENNCQRNLSFEPVCDYVSQTLLASLIFYAPVALNFMYATNEVDMQILAAQQGWRLVYAHLCQDADGPTSDKFAEMPGFALFVHAKHKIACLGIRGTVTINDVVTDIRALPVNFPESERFSSSHGNEILEGQASEPPIDEECWTTIQKGQGLALCGMAGAAYNLFHENIDSLVLYARRGYRIRITGHSLGGAVAALLGSLVRRQLAVVINNEEIVNPESKQQESRSNMDLDDVLRVYSYGSPACVDAKLSDYCQTYVVSCVCHDDVIPRLTPTSIRGLLKHLLYIKSTWVNKNLSDDLLAITRRVKGGWAPKLRNGFTLLSTSASTIKACKKKLKTKRLQLKRTTVSTNEMDLPRDINNLDIVGSSHIPENALKSENECSIDREALPDIHDGGIFYEGDCFYEVAEELVEESDDDDSDDGHGYFSLEKSNIPTSQERDHTNEERLLENIETQPVLMEELPLPRMYLPGKIVHIYTHRGGYKAAIIPRTFRELRRISMAGNMLNDHLGGTYYAALLECMTIRRAPDRLPDWIGFDEESTCSCCSSSFTWASTSDSEAQEARDKHNCRSCGSLVCDSCSKNRVAVPRIGITVPVRVCNSCYNNLRIRSGDSDVMTRSIHDYTNDDHIVCPANTHIREARRAKRNHVVDELATSVFKI